MNLFEDLLQIQTSAGSHIYRNQASSEIFDSGWSRIVKWKWYSINIRILRIRFQTLNLEL